MIPNFNHISEPDKFIMARKMILSYIQQVIKDKNLIQNEIAEKMGIKSSSLSRMLKGEFSPSLDLLLKLCDAVGCYPFIIEKDANENLAGVMRDRWQYYKEDN
jgi:transcriptional regulator with XRE-family HTH domain